MFSESYGITKPYFQKIVRTVNRIKGRNKITILKIKILYIDFYFPKCRQYVQVILINARGLSFDDTAMYSVLYYSAIHFSQNVIKSVVSHYINTKYLVCLTLVITQNLELYNLNHICHIGRNIQVCVRRLYPCLLLSPL
jgi:hypothetical protein